MKLATLSVISFIVYLQLCVNVHKAGVSTEQTIHILYCQTRVHAY